MNQKDVRSGTSFWRVTGSDPVTCPPLQESTHCDVAIIGGGITGALISETLSRLGMNVVILDQGEMGLGSTAGSTGLLQYEVDTPLVELITKVGEPAAVSAYRQGVRAVVELESLAGELGLQTQFSRRSTLCLASSAAEIPDLRQEFECRRHFGFDVQWLEESLLFEGWGLRAPAALRSEGDGEVNPYQLTQALIRRALAQGARAFGETRVSDLHEGPMHVVVRTSKGEVIANSVVIATGYFASSFLSENDVTLKTTYATVGQQPVPDQIWSDKCLIWETARPYFYARQTGAGTAMIGGEDTPYADDHADEHLLAEKARRLSRQFEKLFPRTQFSPECVWAGTFAETKDGLPFIGRPPGRERVYAALGYGGNGITFSTIAARLLGDSLMGRAENEEAAPYRFGR